MEPEISKATAIRSLLDELKLSIDSMAHATIGQDGIYGCALRSAIVKSFEFTALAHQDPPPAHAFFITATLRGICEDLITFAFLETLSKQKRNEALSLLNSATMAEGVAAQTEFFGASRRWQPVVHPYQNATEVKQKLQILGRSVGWTGKQPWPTVWFMAKVTNLHALYNYLYSATSKWVHFSPQILFRMGWSGERDKKEDLGNDTEWIFTTAHFSKYYADFNSTYSLLLLLKMLQGPAARLVPDTSKGVIAALDVCLNKPLRWPETVTFEELNLEGPGTFERMVLRVAHESESSSDG